MRRILALALLCTPFLACKSEPHGYTLVLIKTGPMNGKLTKEETGAAFDGHFSNMAKLAEEHKLVAAGPYGKTHHEDLHGLFVINSAKRAEATEWASTDPATRAGIFVLEYHDFATDAPLLGALERDLAKGAAAKAAGKQLAPADRVRPYVLLTCDDGETAQRELEPLKGGGGVLLVARVDGAHAFALLDAKDVADARDKYAFVLDRIGKCDLDDWYASDELAHL